MFYSFYIFRKKEILRKKYNLIGHKSQILLFIRNFRILVDFTKKSPLCSTSRCRAIVNIYVIYEAEGNFWSNKPIFPFCSITQHSNAFAVYLYDHIFLMYDSRPHSSLVDYLAQVIYAKNCPTTFYCIFQLVQVPMTTTQNIRLCFLSSNNTLFS